MLVEINRVPGLPTIMFDKKIATKFVRATAMAVERLANERSQLPATRHPQQQVPSPQAFAVS
jgi:hypothetical protein